MIYGICFGWGRKLLKITCRYREILRRSECTNLLPMSNESSASVNHQRTKAKIRQKTMSKKAHHLHKILYKLRHGGKPTMVSLPIWISLYIGMDIEIESLYAIDNIYLCECEAYVRTQRNASFFICFSNKSKHGFQMQAVKQIEEPWVCTLCAAKTSMNGKSKQ